MRLGDGVKLERSFDACRCWLSLHGFCMEGILFLGLCFYFSVGFVCVCVFFCLLSTAWLL